MHITCSLQPTCEIITDAAHNQGVQRVSKLPTISTTDSGMLKTILKVYAQF